jgi:diguanylate cyclase (GGDEF)-like protein
MKLSTKASLLLTGIVLAVIVAMSFFLFECQRKATRALIDQQLESEANALANGIHGFMEEKKRAVAAIAGNFPVGALQSGDIDTVREYLGRQLSFHPDFESGLFVLDRDGRFLADFPVHSELRGQVFSSRDYFQRTMAQEKGVVGAPYISTRTGLPVLTITAPVRSDSGRIEAVVCGSLDLLAYSALGYLQERRIGKAGYVYLVDRNRQFLVHPDRARVLKTLGEGHNVFLDKAVGGFEGTGETINSLGVPMLVAARQVPDLGWVLLAQMPVQEATASVREGIPEVGLFFMAALAVVLPVGLLMMRRIARPLEVLEGAVQIVTQDLRKSEGSLARPFAATALDALRKMRSSDEIGNLARAFFQLSVRLKHTLGSLRAAVNDWERTFASVQEALLVLDSDGKVLRLNRVAENLFRTVKTDAVGRHWRDVLASGHGEPADWPTSETLGETGSLKLTSALPGTPGMFDLSFSAIVGRRGSNGFLLMVTDVTEKMRAAERIRELAFHDGLTRLPNRLLLTDRLEQAIATAERNGSRVGVLFLDLDNFKLVNDTYGHVLGDELLRQVAKRLTTCLRSNDTLARFAGDEFVAVIMDLADLDEAATIASRMLLCLKEPFDLSENHAHIGASIGIAVYPEDGATPALLVAHADQAMYRVKGHGKSSFWPAGSPAATPGEGRPEQ